MSGWVAGGSFKEGSEEFSTLLKGVGEEMERIEREVVISFQGRNFGVKFLPIGDLSYQR